MSLLRKINNFIPVDWSTLSNKPGKLVSLDDYSCEYARISSIIDGKYFCKRIESIQRFENKYLYAQFLLNKAQYEARGLTQIKELYHDTAQGKIQNIFDSNLDYRKATRVKFGCGVSFSPDVCYANQQSSRNNGINRSMIVAEVLVGKAQSGSCFMSLPAQGYDTTVGNGCNVYVKYYDNEFYPKYIINYTDRRYL